MKQRRLLQALRDTSRCNARSRTGTPCRRPAIRGRKRCRLHGGLSPGAPKGSQNGNYTNGEWTAEAIEERRWLRSLVRTFAKTGQIDE
jgi:glucans biosynthesis protein